LSNIILKKTTSSIFLTIVLIAGTFATISSPSSFITDVNADQCGEDVEACFERLLTQSQFEKLSAKLVSSEGTHIDIPGVDFPTLRSFEDICSALGSLDSEGLSTAVNELIPQIFDSIQIPVPSNARVFVECIVDAINKYSSDIM
jgi:hypothetical protein